METCAVCGLDLAVCAGFKKVYARGRHRYFAIFLVMMTVFGSAIMIAVRDRSYLAVAVLSVISLFALSMGARSV